MVEGVFKEGPGQGADWQQVGWGAERLSLALPVKPHMRVHHFFCKCPHKSLLSLAFKATQKSVGQHSQVLQLQVRGPNRFRSLATLSALLPH